MPPEMIDVWETERRQKGATMGYRDEALTGFVEREREALRHRQTLAAQCSDAAYQVVAFVVSQGKELPTSETGNITVVPFLAEVSLQLADEIIRQSEAST